MPVQAQELAGLFGDIHGVEYKFYTAAEDQPVWSVRALSAIESISGTYTIELELGSDETPRNPYAMLGKSCSVRFSRAAQRWVHGVVASIADGASTAALTVVHLTIVPALAALKHVSSSRIFSEIAIGELAQGELEKVFKPFKRSVTLDLMQTEYPKREYIVQHRESDLTFFDRILAEQGLWYYFEHPSGEDQAERLVITDSVQKAPAISDEPELELLRERERSPTQEAITSFGLQDAIGTNGVRVRQFNWTHPDVVEDVEKSASDASGLALGAYEHGDVAGFEYQAPRYRKHETEAQAQLRLERHQHGRHVYRGESNVVLMRPGHFMVVEGTEYLITRVTHLGKTVFNTGGAAHRGEYHNTFECIPRERAYRPHLPEKPRMVGVQTALVVGRDGGTQAPGSSAHGEDIVTDEHGRVRVKFHWDLTTAGKGGSSSCWVRVAQGWAGQGWGTQFIPRVGMEVVVQFVDGDPDRPLITGCVYNGLNPPPYRDKPTQSGIRTASSVDLSRYNELRFEDAKDQEQIFVRAQKDYVEEVLNDHSTTVTGNQRNTVKKSQTESIRGDQSLAVTGKRTKVVGGDEENGEEITVKGERKTTVTKRHIEILQSEHDVTVTKSVTESYLLEHTRKVKGPQTFALEKDKTETIQGTYNLTTDTGYRLTQGGSMLTLEGDNVSLKTPGPFSVDVNAAATLTLDGQGNIVLKGNAAISLEVGANKIAISPSGIEISGMQVAVTAGSSSLELGPAGANLKGVMTTVEAQTMCAVKGLTLQLNS
jgi:type VI secretion system secreted protein VgrG